MLSGNLVWTKSCKNRLKILSHARFFEEVVYFAVSRLRTMRWAMAVKFLKCQTPSETNGRTDGRRDVSSSVSARGVHTMGGGTNRDASQKFKKGSKIPESANKYTKFGQMIIRKIIKIIATRCHNLRLKCTKFYSWRLSVRSFVFPSVFFWHGPRVAATSTRRDGGDRGGRCWCAEACVSFCPPVRSFVRSLDGVWR